jgi:hypothetical protein
VETAGAVMLKFARRFPHPRSPLSRRTFAQPSQPGAERFRISETSQQARIFRGVRTTEKTSRKIDGTVKQCHWLKNWSNLDY